MKHKSKMVRNSLLALGSVALLSAGLTLAVAPANTLVIQRAGEMVTMDPQQVFDSNATSVVNNVYDTLVTFERNTTKLVPMLATDWKISSDGKTITMGLRKGVKFHSGNDFTCADAEYSLHRLLVTGNASSAAFYLAQAMLGFQYWDEKTIKSTPFSTIRNAASCTANGDLVIKLMRREPIFILRLTGTWGSILDAKAAIAAGEWDGTEATWKEFQNKDTSNSSLNKIDVGSGAYQMVAREADQAVFKANPNYWGEKGKLQNVIVNIVNNDAGSVLAMKSGDADIITYGNTTSLVQLKGAPGVTIYPTSSVSANGFFFNQAINKGGKFSGSGKLDGKGIPADFFADANVRRAFAAATDQKRIVTEIYSGLAELRTMPVPSIVPGYDANLKTIPFNLEASKGEFQKAFKGQVWKNGFAFVALIPAGNAGVQSIMDLLKQNLERINPKFKMTVKALPLSELYPALGMGVTPFTLNGNSAEVPDALALLSFFYSSQGVFAAHTHFKDARIDKLLSDLSTTEDLSKRAALVTQIGRRGNELLPIIVLPESVTVMVARSSLKGVKENFNAFRYTALFWNSLSK